MDRDQRGDNVVEKIPLEGPSRHDRRYDTCGDYTAHLIHSDGTSSPPCQFAICDLELGLPSSGISLGKEWTVRFDSENMNVIASVQEMLCYL